VASIHTSSGEVVKGMTWDEALPLLGSYDEREPITKDMFATIYRIAGKTYAVTFQRPAMPELGPYKIVGFYRRAE
jgi:hypothetical protein